MSQSFRSPDVIEHEGKMPSTMASEEYNELGENDVEGPDFPEFDLHQPNLSHIEELDQYEQGGYHPILLYDTFEEERYRVVHKLGYGGSSTVWLARDNLVGRYVALKVLCAEASDDVCDIKILDYLKDRATTHPGRQHISFLYDCFRFQGPNGSHLCLVSEVLGPTLSQLMKLRKQLRGSISRKVAMQFTQAVAYLHSEGVCHGDLTAANIAFELANFDSWSEDELYERIGRPKTEAIRTASGNVVPDSAPRYVVQPASFTDGGSRWIRDTIRIIDFGIAFFVDEPPKDLGTPPSFTAPEAWFEMAAGKSTDLWALGCTLYTLRSGATLIQLYWGGTPVEVIGEICSFLGPLPERWDRLWFDEEGMPKPRDETSGEDTPPSWTREEAEETQNVYDLTAHITDEYHGPVRAEDQIEREKLPIELEIEAEGGRVIFPTEKPKQKISADEAASFADLLDKVLRWEPAERVSAEDLVRHPWFRGDFPDAQTADNAPPLFQS